MVVRQFDVPKKKADDALGAAEAALLELANGLDIEEASVRHAAAKYNVDGDKELGDNSDEPVDDDEEGWFDERDELTADELKELNNSVRPVRLILVKVSLVDHFRK
jgi:hypothetical protein